MAVGLAAQFLLSTVVARSLPTTGFGRVSVVLAVVALAGPLWSHLAHQTARAVSDTEVLSLLRQGGFLGLLLGVVALILAALPGLGAYRVPVAVSAMLLSAMPSTAALTGSASRSGGAALALSQMGRGPVLVALVAAAAFSTELTPVTVLMLYGIGTMLYVLVVRSILPVEGVPDPRIRFGALMRMGVPLIIGSIATVATHRLDLVMLGWISGPGDAGMYQTALVVTGIPLMLHGAALSTYVPSLRGVTEAMRLRRHYALAAETTALLAVPLVVGVGLWGDVIVEMVFGGRYLLPRGVYLLLSAGLLIHVLSGPNGATMVARGRDGRLAWITAVQAGVNIVLNAVLIPSFGAEGAATATFVSYAVANSGYLWVLRPDVGGAWQAWTWLKFPVLMLATLTLISLVTRMSIGSRPVSLIVGAGAMLVAAAGILLSRRHLFSRESVA